MSDLSVSCVGSSIDTSVYLASEAERTILVGLEGYLLTSKSNLGPAVMNVTLQHGVSEPKPEFDRLRQHFPPSLGLHKQSNLRKPTLL